MNTIITSARAFIGTPYHHQASLKGVGCDCLGLIRGVWREVYGQEPIELPNYTPDWAEASGEETMRNGALKLLSEVVLSEIQPSDLLLFRWREGLPAKHCGILTTSATFIHAHDGASVTETAFNGWWKRHLAYAFRFPLLTSAAVMVRCE